MRQELFLACSIGHVSTPQTILDHFPRAEFGCPVNDAKTCLWDRDAAQRALMWAIVDHQPLIAVFLITECGARVDKISSYPGEAGLALSPVALARRLGKDRIREIVDEAYAEIRLVEIVSGKVASI